MPAENKDQKRLEPLVITCKSADCEKGLHCFSLTRKMKISNQSGQCRYCGAKLVNWKRVHNNDISDAAYTFSALRYELWRHYYWHIPIDKTAINHARRKGIAGMHEAIEKRIRHSVAASNPYRDGMQTPRSANAIYYAQHATATCCRKCIEYWHGIPLGQELNDDQIRYFSELIMFYLKERLPYLTEQGEKIPWQRKGRA